MDINVLEDELKEIKIQSIKPDPSSSIPLYDVMDGMSGFKVDISEHGFIQLVDCMPRLVPIGRTMESAIVRAARVSYGQGLKTIEEDNGLIKYLMRHEHTTPFEMVEFCFLVVMPVFVARQWIRHRTANVNEYSARYSVVKDCFFRPTIGDICSQSSSNKQGRSDQCVDSVTAEEFLNYLDKAESLHHDYKDMIDKGVSRETARIGLPLTMMTEMYWKCDLHNILRFLSLRMDSHAQKEIRDYANAMFVLIRQFVPTVCNSFLNYTLGSISLSFNEISAIQNNSFELGSNNKREQVEFIEKLKKIKGNEYFLKK